MNSSCVRRSRQKPTRIAACLSLAVVCLAGLSMRASATTQNESEDFRTPSKNIHCSLFEGSLRCMVLDYVGSEPPKPADCYEDWGAGATLELRGRAGLFVCAGDTIESRTSPILAYGSTWKRGGFVCKSTKAGLTCLNRSNRGFFLSRKSVRRV
jgi:hypothetical protein